MKLVTFYQNTKNYSTINKKKYIEIIHLSNQKKVIKKSKK